MKPRDEKEKERLEPGTAPQTKPLPPRSRKRNAAALPGSQNADLAWEYCKILGSPETQQGFVGIGGATPALRSVAPWRRPGRVRSST